MVKKKAKKYGAKNVGKAFGKAGSWALQKYKARQAYLKSPEYKAKVQAAKQAQLKELDYQIALAKRQRALAKARGTGESRTAKQVQRPMGIDLGAELGLS